MVRSLALFVFVALASCGGDSPTLECVFMTDSKGALTCEGSPDGCICGVDDGCGHANGGCVNGACCTGCVTEDADGSRECKPGHGVDGLYGSHGGHCSTTPQ